MVDFMHLMHCDPCFSRCLFQACSSEALPGHKIFEVSEQLVVLRVAEQLGGGFETGGRLWGAGCQLLGLALAGALDELLFGDVLELGAGTGLLGLSLALMNHTMTLSDKQPQAITNIRNI